MKNFNRDNLVSMLVAAAACEVDAMNNAYNKGFFLENRQHYGCLSAFTRVLSDLGVDISAQYDQYGDLVHCSAMEFPNLKF